MWIQLRTFGSLCHTEFLLWRRTEELWHFTGIALLLQSSCFFCYSENRVTVLIVVCSLPWLLRCSEPLLTPKCILYILYLHTHTYAGPYSFCYLSVYLTREMFLFHIINLMMVMNCTIATHIRSATIFNARVEAHINTLFVQKDQLYSWQS